MAEPVYQRELVTLYEGECVAIMGEMAEASVDAIVTDPPYGLEFMGKEWDRLGPVYAGGNPKMTAHSTTLPEHGHGGVVASGAGGVAYGAPKKSIRCRRCGKLQRGNGCCKCPSPDWTYRHDESGFQIQAWHSAWTTAALRVLKPGGHVLAFGGTRTHHRLMCALEDAGFEIRDCLMWLYGSGFPKSLDVSKAIDKAAGAAREPSTYIPNHKNAVFGRGMGGGVTPSNSQASTDAAREWAGWGTALKPSWEICILARKPLGERNVAANVLRHGTGALNIDGCRIAGSVPSVPQPDFRQVGGRATHLDAYARIGTMSAAPLGRWPANLALDEEAAAMLDAQSGEKMHGAGHAREGSRDPRPVRHDATSYSIARKSKSTGNMFRLGDTGGASRFFYTAKADREDRDGSRHPTVKPVDLMKWLITLVTPPSGVVLDPFMGSGTTIYAARALGIKSIGIDREPAYVQDAVKRLRQEVLVLEAST